MMNQPEIVNGLWIKGPLSALEQLTIHSFLAQGFRFQLWTYHLDSIQFEHEGLVLKDARAIIPEEQVFSYRADGPLGMGKGSFAGFSDIFRYKLLYELGGWWTDMDVCCLKLFHSTAPYQFRWAKHQERAVVGNIMKVPAQSALMQACYERAIREIRADNTNWMLPIRILREEIDKAGLAAYAAVISNDDSWMEVRKLLISEYPLPNSWHFIHWMQEEFRVLGVPKDRYLTDSTMGRLMEYYGLGSALQPEEKRQYLHKTGIAHYLRIHAGRGSISQMLSLIFSYLMGFIINRRSR